MQNNLETKESNKNLATPVVNKVSKGKKFYGFNYHPNGNKFDFNPNLDNKPIQSQSGTSNLFPSFLSRKAIINSFLDQKKTIYLQRILKGADNETIEFIVNELRGTYSDIIKDKNGNYFCSDLVKVCGQKDRIKILEELSPTICEDCLDPFASRTIQVFIERASSEIEYIYILNSFNDYNNFLCTTLDSIGFYTIQKIIDCIPGQYRINFNVIFVSFFGLITKTKFGIVIVKKFIKKTKDENINLLIMNFIRKNFMDIAVNQYANYLIQFLLEEWRDTPQGNEIKKIVFENFQEMCEKKYSSFICELFIKIIKQEEKTELIKTLDLDYLLKSNNRHVIKIVIALGILENENINFNIPPFSINNNYSYVNEFKKNNINNYDEYGKYKKDEADINKY